MKEKIIDNDFVLDKTLKAISDLDGQTDEEKKRVYTLLSEMFDVLNVSDVDVIKKHNKIVKDKLAVCDDKGNYKITALGKIFLEAGGYTKETELRYEKAKDLAVRVGTILGSIWVVIQII